MSQYNKTVLTHAGLELAKRANAGQAKFGITRAVTSADDWSHKTVQDLEEVTTIPNIMQQGTIMDTDEVESSNSVIGVSLCFTNKNSKFCDMSIFANLVFVTSALYNSRFLFNNLLYSSTFL